MITNRAKRHNRTRKKVSGTNERPRLSVFRSLTSMYAQIIDDEKSVTLLGISDKAVAKENAKKKMTKSEKAYMLGKKIGEEAVKAKITKVVFDRGGNKYHGRVAEFAKGAREAGLEF